MTVLVSVCIPVYDVEKYIERCARSLFEQTLDSMEYIFIDDCSPDNSIAVMQRVLEEYPYRKDQVKIIRHEVNQGVGAARNHGVAACTGDYITHCDPDDWVDLNMYETMYNKAIETNADMVCCSSICVYANNKKSICNINSASSVSEFIKNNLGGNLNSLCMKLYKQKIALDSSLYCPENICMGEDLLRNIQMLKHCKEIAFCPNVYYYYFRNNTNASTRNLTRHYLDQFIEVTNILGKIDFDGFPEFHLTLQAQVLFVALKSANISTEEYKALYSTNEFKNILGLKTFPLWKKTLLVIAKISYPLAKCICSLLMRIKF